MTFFIRAEESSYPEEPLSPPTTPMPDTSHLVLPPVPNSEPEEPEIPETPNNYMELSVAWMMISGVEEREIERILEQEPGFLTTLRIKPEFRDILRLCSEVKAQTIASSEGTPEELLDAEIKNNIAALVAMRTDPTVKDTTRYKAISDMLDRAPKAPKARREVEQQHTVIALPVSDLRNMQTALLEEGSPDDLEIIELLEGADFTIEKKAPKQIEEGVNVERV